MRAFDAHGIDAAPSVIGPEVVGDEDVDEPAEDEQQPGSTIVYLPVAAPMGSDQHNVTVQLRATDADELTLPVFRDLETLIACCGQDQAWISVATGDLDDIVAQTGADTVVVDAVVPGHEQDGSADA